MSYRYRDIAHEGRKYRLRDDGYRIEAQFIEPVPVNAPPKDEWVLWAEYKHCDFPAIGDAVADFLMTTE